jgi:hypothetical protein
MFYIQKRRVELWKLANTKIIPFLTCVLKVSQLNESEELELSSDFIVVEF